MSKIQIIVGTNRPGNVNHQVAQWVYDEVSKVDGIEAELVDFADFDLPLLDEPVPPSQYQYSKDHTKKWGAKIAEADGYIFVTPEYNHSIPGSLKNAIDFLYTEWNNKAAGIVNYGWSADGYRAAEQLRTILSELQIAHVRAQVGLNLGAHLGDNGFEANDTINQKLHGMLEQLLPWTEAMKTVRS